MSRAHDKTCHLLARNRYSPRYAVTVSLQSCRASFAVPCATENIRCETVAPEIHVMGIFPRKVSEAVASCRLQRYSWPRRKYGSSSFVYEGGSFIGRFGNQADHFLGALAFSRALDRTLALPPWVEYRPGEPKSVQVPFNTYFKVEPLTKYHRVITMEQFMQDLAPTIWPPGNRTVFCYQQRASGQGCQAKEGNPFGPFWDTFGVDFDESMFYSPLQYDIHYRDMARKWKEKYPSDKYPVLAFVGAPATFPVQQENLALQSYLVWSDAVLNKARHFIRTSLRVPFIGIHLRNGIDWVRACEHLDASPLLFSAPQCVGYMGERGPLPALACLPTAEVVTQQVVRVVRALRARSVFVATDNDAMLDQLNRALEPLQAVAVQREPSDPHVDLAILGLANHFVGNCVSSFTAFVKRHRDVHGLPSSFWAFQPLAGDGGMSASERIHQEL